jgi:hypothetical protein
MTLSIITTVIIMTLSIIAPFIVMTLAFANSKIIL